MPDKYECWELNDINNPYPVDEIQVTGMGDYISSVSCNIRFPVTAPFNKSEAERSAGIARKWRFTVSMRSVKTNGKLSNVIHCTAKHLHWWEEHGEEGQGGVIDLEVDQRTVLNKRRDHIIADMAHGPSHFDRVTLSYLLLATGEVFVQIMGVHEIAGKIGEVNKPVIVEPRPAPEGTQPVPPSGQPPKPRPEPRPEPLPEPPPDIGPLTKRGRVKK